MKYLILTSPTTENNVSQSSIFYIAAMIKQQGWGFDILDLSGQIDYYNPPKNLYQRNNLWLSKNIFDETWIDKYLPEPSDKYDFIFCSALFSIDIILQGRYVEKCKELNSKIKAVIGGAALKNLGEKQEEIILTVFDGICKNNIPCEPDYSLHDLKDLVTVLSGSGCNWGKCKFCNSNNQAYYVRNRNDILNDFINISELSDSEIMLSSDSMGNESLLFLAKALEKRKNGQKYNIMMRADSRTDGKFADTLYSSGCTDAFVGVEILDNGGLNTTRKGVTVKIIQNTVESLNKAGIKVPIGLILFLPQINKEQLKNQLINLEKILPYIDSIELETLSVVYGSEYYNNYKQYGIDLYPDKNLIFDYWCYGLSPDIPWTFKNKDEFKMWLDYSDELKKLIYSYVDKQYWWSIDYIKEMSLL